MRKVLEGCKGPDERKIKVVEESGESLKSALQQSDPNKDITCPYPDCPVCMNSLGQQSIPKKGPTRCQVPNVGYRLTCLKCKEEEKKGIYYGESTRPAYVRGKEHREDLKFKRDRSVLYRHAEEIHNSEDIPWMMEVVKTFQKCLERQIDEGTRISNNVDSADYILNNKNEWNGAVSTKWTAAPQEAGGSIRHPSKDPSKNKKLSKPNPKPNHNHNPFT